MTPLDEMGRFATVVVDPPWQIQLGPILERADGQGHWHSNEKLGYPSMSLDEIASLPIGSVLAENAMLFCWTVNKMLPHTFAMVEAWAGSYAFTMTWLKQRGPQFPGGPCFNTEWVVVGKRGAPKFTSTKALSVGNFWKHTAHSEKPEGFYDLLRRVTPGPRLDVFGRRRIEGFTSWGNEAPEGAPSPGYYQQVFA